MLFLLLHKKILCYSRATETYVCSTVQWILVNSVLPGMRLIHLKDLRLFKKACHLDGKSVRPGYQNSWGISLPWVKISGLRLFKASQLIFLHENRSGSAQIPGQVQWRGTLAAPQLLQLPYGKGGCFSQPGTGLGILHPGFSLTVPHKAVDIYPVGIALRPKGPSRGELPPRVLIPCLHSRW